MRAAELAAPVAAELPKEFEAPVSHSSLWLLLALLALTVMAVYYIAVTLWARPRRPAPPPAPVEPPRPARDPRTHSLSELARIEHEVATGSLTARAGHQQVSVVTREFVGEVSSLPADKMALADLRAAGAGPLAEAIALMYPPSFAPSEEGRAAELLPEALGRARHLVTGWI